jgi:hypothetical protein
MKKHTALDFFGNNMAILSFKLESNNITQEEYNVKLYGLFNQAKEMEKQQIIDAHLNGQAEFDEEGYRYEVIANSEQYYNETYYN